MSFQTKTLKSPFLSSKLLTPVRFFIISTMVVNAGNYLYNLVLGRTLSPENFSEAGLMVTLLLVFSFLAMTFQIVTTKFSIELQGDQLQQFDKWIRKISLISAGIISLAIIAFHSSIGEFFQLESPLVWIIFAAILPLYFLMSVERGEIQGKEAFYKLSSSYQLEMWVRFGATFLIIHLMNWPVAESIVIAIALSILAGYLATEPSAKFATVKSSSIPLRRVYTFFLMTAAYESAQILINYSDILLVKHYFDASQAGLYTSISLIGRMIYFVTWMVVMVLIPKVIRLKKENGDFKSLLIKNFTLIAGFSSLLILGAYLFSDFIILTFFGQDYLSVASLLWVYALATALFALANIFVYYFLSLDKYLPVFIAIFMGIVQVGLFIAFHDSLAQIIWVQVINMGILLMSQMIFFMQSK
jgi:O-antigen/teichoic acid export membrane protein